jgi:hypothetical protein
MVVGTREAANQIGSSVLEIAFGQLPPKIHSN